MIKKELNGDLMNVAKNDLNKKQGEVVNFGRGSLFVEAGPGSGKTTVIVERIEELIKKGVEPETFLVITFTTKAADNLKSKLRKKFSNDIVLKMQISTIHSFCLEYLKSKNQSLTLLDDDTSEKKTLFIQKYKEELGFVNESTVLDYQIPAVLNKFGEYTCFNVDSQELIKKIKDSRVITKEYLDFVNSLEYFSKKRIDDYDKPIKNDLKKDDPKYEENDVFANSWYNARYLQVAKAYPKYLKLLDKYNYVDYDTLQLKALNELEKDSQTRFKTIFVDEFQDTDPLQFRIFEILRADCDYFTAVGDVDQHIYAFRSSFNDFFDEIIRLPNADADTISLDVNYRSTENIVNLTEAFITPQRKETSQKHMRSVGKGYNNPNFLIENEDSKEEADKIYEVIKFLKEKNLIQYYCDVAVLYRKHSDKTIEYLIKKFNNDEDINFSFRGQSDLSQQSEVKSLITMLWYVSRKTSDGYVPSKDELDISKEVNLKAFCADYFKPSLDKSTKDYLNCLQQSFFDELMKIEPEYREKEGDDVAKKPHTIKKNKTQDSIIQMFKRVKMPEINLQEIKNEDDKKFFEKLEDIRSRMKSEEPPEIIDIFYELVSLGDWFSDVKNNYKEIANLALLTQTISNYQSFISETNVRGLLFFLRSSIENYDSYHEDGKGVQLMTIHAAKGLEFPVTIITSLQKDKFPMVSKDPKREKDFIFPNDTFYTPNQCLKYKTILKENDNGELVHKTISIEEENELDAEEENRVLYVAMTRAADLLILSTIGEPPEQIDWIRNHLKPLSFDDLSKVTICEHYDNKDDETLVLNYSKYTKYCSCPFKYNLGYNLGFTRPGIKAANRGTVFHNIMEKANLKLIEGKVLSNEELTKLIFDNYKLKFDVNENPVEYEKFKNNVINYYEEYSLNREVLEAELDFEIERNNYLLNGAIDLIYKTGENEIVILDYKYAEYDKNHIDGYIKQAHLYAAAVRELPQFKDYNIKESIIHFVLNDHQHIVEINDNEINNELKCLDKVACDILNPDKEFSKDSEDCDRCSYRIFCKP